MENITNELDKETDTIIVAADEEDTRMNKFNLELLVNPVYQKGIVKTEKDQVKNCKTDLKFYRKRILALTNDYIKGNYEQHGATNEALRHLHFEYVYNVIQYFKMTDTIDIIQHEHAIDISYGIVPPPTSTPTPTSSPIPGTSPTPSTICDFISHHDAQLNVKHVNTLDSYVKRTKKAVKNPISLPVNRVINYHVPELKNKGVKESKEAKESKEIKEK